MKKTLLVILAVLLCVSFADAQIISIVKKKAGGGGDLGNTSIESTGYELPTGYSVMYRVQASASGTLGTAYAYYVYGSTETSVKVCVYTSTSTTPQTADARVGCTSDIATGASTGWKSGSIGSGSITSGNYYWVLYLVSGNSWYGRTATTATSYYHDAISYASPPADFSAAAAGFSADANLAPQSVYVHYE